MIRADSTRSLTTFEVNVPLPTAEEMRSYQTSGGTANTKAVASVPSLLAQKPSLQSNNTGSFIIYSNVSEEKPGNECYNYGAIYNTCSFNT